MNRFVKTQKESRSSLQPHTILFSGPEIIAISPADCHFKIVIAQFFYHVHPPLVSRIQLFRCPAPVLYIFL